MDDNFISKLMYFILPKIPSKNRIFTFFDTDVTSSYSMDSANAVVLSILTGESGN